MKETNNERTIKERCERSCGNIGKTIALWALFQCLSYNAKKKVKCLYRHLYNVFYKKNDCYIICSSNLIVRDATVPDLAGIPIFLLMKENFSVLPFFSSKILTACVLI